MRRFFLCQEFLQFPRRCMSASRRGNYKDCYTRTIMDLEICRSNPKGETIFLIARELHISLDAIAHAGTSRPNSVSADVLEFFSGKDDAESKDYINLCRQVEMMKNKEDQ